MKMVMLMVMTMTMTMVLMVMAICIYLPTIWIVYMFNARAASCSRCLHNRFQSLGRWQGGADPAEPAGFSRWTQPTHQSSLPFGSARRWLIQPTRQYIAVCPHVLRLR